MKKKGFTLVELLVVVAIIGILSVILVPNVRENMRRAKVAKTAAMIGNISLAVVTYKSDTGKYPDSYNPQLLYAALIGGKTPFELEQSSLRMIRQGEKIWINSDVDPNDDRREDILRSSGVPSSMLTASKDEFVIIDAWDNPIYYISSDEYNPGGRTNYKMNMPCAYEVDRSNARTRPYKPSSFQLISFGEDGTTITPTSRNGGVGSMIDTDKIDNDQDDYIDKEDRRRDGDIMANQPSVVAEDDITNFQ
ncbi:MAG: prepilin-type N-terminal cleavage/methylation domain-containing protein [Candidatus Omnitrophota bacterium]|jgi:prepilin-type N-terminal cleavage/methylation domain-containing protein|nr:MAG: prepilin-type N-terminal cleavage/methylation domain-containing protein [Candidatus Omnitrophota bacterium]